MTIWENVAGALNVLFRGPEDDKTPLRSSPKPDTYLTDDQYYRRRDYRGFPTDRSAAAEADITCTACINFRSNQIRRIRWKLIDNHTGEAVTTSPFHNMLKWHHRQHRTNFFDRWMWQLLVHGNVYMKKIYREDNNLPGGIQILNSTYIEPEIDYGILQFFRYTPPNIATPLFITREAIMWDILPSTLSDQRGKSPLDKALTAVNIDRDNMLTIRSFLKGHGIPPGLITLDPNHPAYDEDEIAEFRAIWDEQKGADAWGDLKFMPGAFNYNGVDASAPNMIYSYEMASLICRAFSIDPELIGVYDQTDSSNTKIMTQMETKFINALTAAVIPDLRHLEEFINDHVLEFLAPMDRYTFAWDYNEIDRMIRYSDTAIDQLRSDLMVGVITKDEYREARFFPPLGKENGGDVFIVPKGYVHIRREDMNELSLMKELDPKTIEQLKKQNPAIAASASPDFLQTAVPDEQSPGGRNRYPVAENNGNSSKGIRTRKLRD